MAKRERTERVPVAMAAESRPMAWLREFRLSGFALSALLLIVTALVVLAPSLKTLVEQQQRIAQLRADVEAAEAEVGELQAQVDRWSDPAYIEAQARDRLYYVFPGDVSYLVIGSGDDEASLEEPEISDKIQATRVDWMRALVGSLYTAGLTDAEPDELASPVQKGQTP
ncbi:FtsB family cell division protein [Homoserinibacter sp. YIM 151385]|uniref:FtsB family cell division protein n=1 Tax=Homoserinibacter sp. YIM 151385 TaxID=2985506 RepID=UPI0022F12483|nr:septum formation initiator family protein [Homoserinibacter sp. YIM 151385]WBU38048.1 septum formation initiator family protein [Homoserinibacter sp. YIM 151385]